MGMAKDGGVRLALVGAGGWECGKIAGILSEMGALAAVCDPDEQRAASCGQEYSVNHYGDVGAMILDGTFDGAVVAAPAAARADAASELLGAGKHVCVQWPPACDADGVAALLELAGRRKAVLSCLPAARSSMAADVVRGAASSGAYGRLMSFYMRARGGPAPAYAGPGDDHAGHARAGAVRAAQADAVYAANLAFDTAPQVVFAVSGGLNDGRPEGHLTTILGYGGGSTATVSVNLETGVSSEMAEAVLEGAVITADLSEGSVTIKPAADGSGPDGAAGNRDRTHGGLNLDSYLRPRLGDFVDAVDHGGEPERRGRAARGTAHALAAFKAAKASLLSARRGIPIYLDLR